jgi:hypothetical protein
VQTLITVLFSVLGSTAILAVVAFLIHDSIVQSIRSIQHRFDTKLEEVRTANERELNRFRNALDSQINLASSALLEARRASNGRRLIAIQTLWDGMMQISFNAPSWVVITDVMTTDSYQQVCERVAPNIPRFDDLILERGRSMKSEAYLLPEKTRLLTGDYLYALFFAYRAFVGGISLKLATDRDKGRFEPWWEYDHVLGLLRPVLDEEEWNDFKQKTIGRYTWVIRTLEAKFLRWAEDIMDGRRAATEASEQAREIVNAAANSLSP